MIRVRYFTATTRFSTYQQYNIFATPEVSGRPKAISFICSGHKSHAAVPLLAAGRPSSWLGITAPPLLRRRIPGEYCLARRKDRRITDVAAVDPRAPLLERRVARALAGSAIGLPFPSPLGHKSVSTAVHCRSGHTRHKAASWESAIGYLRCPAQPWSDNDPAINGNLLGV